MYKIRMKNFEYPKRIFSATDLKVYVAHILINYFKLGCILFRISKIAQKSTDLDPNNTDCIYFSIS